MTSIDCATLKAVTEIINAETDPAATADLIEAEICGDWHESQEHQDWLNSALPAEIADWIAGFYEESA